MRQFLGLTSCYRRFIGQFAKIATPLHNLTRKDVSWKWDEECQQAFESLKQKLVQAPILAYPNFERDFVLEMDASVKGVGSVLLMMEGYIPSPMLADPFQLQRETTALQNWKPCR